MGKPWYSPRGKETAEAKRLYESEHPLPVQVTRHGGYFTSPRGHRHFYGGDAGRRVAEMAARADVPPNDLPVVEYGRELFWLGQCGTYPIALSTPEAFRESLRHAIESDTPSRVCLPEAEKVNQQAGNGEV